MGDQIMNPLKKCLMYVATFFSFCGNFLLRIASVIHRQCSRSMLIKQAAPRSLYKTIYDDYYWLNTTGYIDTCIINQGVFEGSSTRIVKKLVKKGDVILDIGANIGYYSVILAKLVGTTGRVLCFEPTAHYRSVLMQNLKANNISNADVFDFGLSDKEQALNIYIDNSTATLHPTGSTTNTIVERIKLITLDTFVKTDSLVEIDFVKIDVDGHEPHFFEGAWQALEYFDPIILLEISHIHFLKAGVTAWDFYDTLKGKGYRIYHEDNLVELISREVFLQKCGNFSYSSNVIISRKGLSP